MIPELYLLYIHILETLTVISIFYKVCKKKQQPTTTTTKYVKNNNHHHHHQTEEGQVERFESPRTIGTVV